MWDLLGKQLRKQDFCGCNIWGVTGHPLPHHTHPSTECRFLEHQETPLGRDGDAGSRKAVGAGEEARPLHPLRALDPGSIAPVVSTPLCWWRG